MADLSTGIFLSYPSDLPEPHGMLVTNLLSHTALPNGNHDHKSGDKTFDVVPSISVNERRNAGNTKSAITNRNPPECTTKVGRRPLSARRQPPSAVRLLPASEAHEELGVNKENLDSRERKFGLTNASICTQTDMGILRDGFRSFFSGHSSLSFAGLGFLFWYLSGKLHLFDMRGHAGKAWIAFIPLMGATLVAISRTMDYRHHPIDVFVGAVVGLAISHYAYRQYFPPLTHPLCHRPYSPRIPRESDEDGEPERPNATPVPPSLAVGVFTKNGSSGPDDTVQRNNPDVSDVWRQGSRRGAAGAHDDRETLVRER